MPCSMLAASTEKVRGSQANRIVELVDWAPAGCGLGPAEDRPHLGPGLTRFDAAEDGAVPGLGHRHRERAARCPRSPQSRPRTGRGLYPNREGDRPGLALLAGVHHSPEVWVQLRGFERYLCCGGGGGGGGDRPLTTATTRQQGRRLPPSVGLLGSRAMAVRLYWLMRRHRRGSLPQSSGATVYQLDSALRRAVSSALRR